MTNNDCGTTEWVSNLKTLSEDYLAYMEDTARGAPGFRRGQPKQEAVAELQQGDANVSGQMGIASPSRALLCLKIHVDISREVA